MASTCPAINPEWKYDVFISFRGRDTRNSFVSHLHRELQRHQMATFIDDKLSGGEAISPALLEKIEQSDVSVVIFSSNYADSPWCLEELAKILECYRTKGQKVLPVFYQVDPTHVQELSGSFGDALSMHEQKWGSEEVQRWKDALKEIANLKGWDSNNIMPETKLIDEIVTDIKNKLTHMPSCGSSSRNSKGLVGIDSRIKEVESLLCLGSSNVRVVGLWGMGGIGKTTIAGVVFNRISNQFEGQYFLPHVRVQLDKCTLVGLRDKVLSKVLGIENLDIGTLNTLPNGIRKMLRRKKVLIVLDDVSTSQQLEALVGEDGLLGQGSRIIVASRDKQVLINRCDDIYEVKDLDYYDALRLFSLHAFKQNYPIKEYMQLSERVVSYVNGIPLALEVFGCYLYKKSVEVWEDKLTKLEENLDTKIQKILIMSYDELDPDERSIFLDIACFFERCNELVQLTLDLKAKSGISRLIDTCLIKISDSKIWMHDLLQQLGRDIVRKENVDDPRKRSRLWNPDDIYHVLTNYQGTEKVQAISVDMSRIKEINLSPSVFKGMYNLRLLDFYGFRKSNLHLREALEYLSNKLRFLTWENYPLKSLPSNFCPENLVGLHMAKSHLEQLWNLVPPLVNLKRMDLSNSVNVIPDLSKVPNLEVLDLRSCNSLVEVPSIVYCTKLIALDLSFCQSLCILPSSIGHLSQLVVLYVKYCENLESIPSSIGQLKRLVKLDLYRCSKLANLPDSIGYLVSLREIDLSDTAIESIPASIEQLAKLTEIVLKRCKRLQFLPKLPSCLRRLNVKNCSSLESVPSIFTQVEKELYEAASENFKFANCRKLGQEARIEIMENAQLRIQRMATSLFEQEASEVYESGEAIGFRFCVPGSEVPEWFTYQNTGGSSLEKIKPTAHCSRNSHFLGFVFCAVVAFRGNSHYEFDITCKCHLITEGGSESDLHFSFIGARHESLYTLKAEHVFIWYDWSIKSHCFLNEASFIFYPPYNKGDRYQVKKCGVDLLFAKDEEQPRPKRLKIDINDHNWSQPRRRPRSSSI